VSEAASKELKELNLGEWEPNSVKKRNFSANSAQLQITEPAEPAFVHNIWLCKALKQFPLLSVAANKLLSAYAKSAAAEHGQLGGASTHHSATASALRQLRRLFMPRQMRLQHGKARNSKAGSMFLFDMYRSPR